MKSYERNNCFFKKNKTKTASLMNAVYQSFINESVRTEPSNNHIIYSLRSEPTVVFTYYISKYLLLVN